MGDAHELVFDPFGPVGVSATGTISWNCGFAGDSLAYQDGARRDIFGGYMRYRWAGGWMPERRGA